MSYRLTEIEQGHSHELLLQNFAANRGNVILVSTCPSLPDAVLAVTANGFMQLSSLTGQSFRLFLSFLSGVPLEAPLRLAELVCCSGNIDDAMICFAFGHDKLLLLARLRTGEVIEMKSFVSRPSCLFADGDHVLCGDGSGELGLWRHHVASDPVLQWSHQVHKAGVCKVRIVRSHVITASDDFSVSILSISTGICICSVPSEASPTAAIVSFGRFSPESFGLLTETGSCTLWSPNTASADDWKANLAASFGFGVSSASLCFDYLLVGSQEGHIALYDAKNVDSFLPLTCFKLEHSVLHVTLTSTSDVVAVTGTGDLWRWPLDEVLSEKKAEDEAAQTVPEPEPQPHVVPDVPCARSAPKTKQYEHDESSPAEEEPPTGEPTPALDTPRERSPYSHATDDPRDEGSTASGFAAPFEFDNQGMEDVEEVIFMDDDFSVATPLETQTVGTQDLPHEEIAPEGVERGEAEEEARDSSGLPQPSPRPDKAALRQSTVNASVEGLKSGRRLKQEAIRQLLERSCQETPTLHCEEQTTSMLHESQVQALNEKFDANEFGQTNQSAAQGLSFQHPIMAVSYEMHEQLLSPGSPQREEGPGDGLLNSTAKRFTRKVDKAFAEELNSKGPSIDDHLCSDLLFPARGASASVLFGETNLETVAPQVILLPLSMAPTPASF